MKWTSKDGSSVEISQVDNKHLINSIRIMREKGHLTKSEFNSLVEMAPNDPALFDIKLMSGYEIFEELIHELWKRSLKELPCRDTDELPKVPKKYVR